MHSMQRMIKKDEDEVNETESVDAETAVRHTLLSMRLTRGYSHVSMRFAILSTTHKHLYPSLFVRELIRDKAFQLQIESSALVSPRGYIEDNYFGSLACLAHTADSVINNATTTTDMDIADMNEDAICQSALRHSNTRSPICKAKRIDNSQM